MNPSVYWPDESLPLAIYCAPGILTGLEILSTDGLLAMPRTGLGIGGLLLGRRSGERLEILKTVAISCSHAMGPSFVLTPEELADAKALDGGAGEDGVDEECALVGWYCSKPNGPMVLSESEKTLFDALCGERGQVALLIRPSLGHITLATFAFRRDGENGDCFQLGTQGELVAPERISAPEEAKVTSDTVAPAQQVTPPEDTTAPESSKPAAAPEKEEAETVPPEPLAIEEPRVMPIPMIPRGGILFGIDVEKEAESEQNPWVLRLLWVVLVLAILGALTYFAISHLPESGISK